MRELNSLYDTLHKNFDFRTVRALRDQTLNMKILNAQFISRIGFISDEIKAKAQQTLYDIEARAIQINDWNAECILDAKESLVNAEDYSGYQINGIAGETMFYVNDIESRFFYPLIGVLQRESNIMQWNVKSVVRRYNPVTQMNQLMTRLEEDYQVLVMLYTMAITNIAREVELIEAQMNDVKRSTFPQLNGVRDYFVFAADRIKDTMPHCNGTIVMT